MTKQKLKVSLRVLAGAALAVPLTACITVKAPEEPIQINLSVDIRQEVLVRLQEDVEQIIQENPDAFPTTPSGGAS